MIWFVLAALCVIAIVLLLLPLARPAQSVAGNPELAVYRSQLEEVSADLSRELISPAEADAARTEIKRKILVTQQVPVSSAAPGRDVRDAGQLLMVMMPTFAVALYLTIGSPSLPSHPFVQSAAPLAAAIGESQSDGTGKKLDDVETMTARLAERLKKEPGDAKGWRMLGWSYASLERYSEAAAAYKRAAALTPTDATTQAQYGEAVVRAAGGVVNADAERSFDAALAIDSKEPRALFFRGLLLDQRGKSREALALWARLLREGDPSAAWMGDLRKRATELATRLKLDPAHELPQAFAPIASAPENGTPGADGETNVAGKRGPAPADVASSSQMTPQQRAEMIDGMVAGLEQRLQKNPNDLDGWLMLARSRTVLGQPAAAKDAITRARRQFANDTDAQGRI